MRLRHLFILVMINSLIIGCHSKSNKKEKIIINDSDSLKFEDNFYLRVSMEDDTLQKKEQRGIIKLFFKMNDTVKKSNQDKRSIYLTLGIVPAKENNSKIKKVEKITKELNLKHISFNDTVQIPFKIKPNFLGKGLITGILTDKYFLYSYHGKDKVRLLSYEHIFEEAVYIARNETTD